MSFMIRLAHRWTSQSATAIVVAGLGLTGIAGCALNMSPGERLAASAREEAESKPPVTTSALSRIMNRQADQPQAEESDAATSKSTTTVARGRLFSAIVDRFPSRDKNAADPFLEGEIEVERERTASERLRDRATASTETADEDNPVRPTTAQRPAPQRTDEELWKLFSNDAVGVVRTGQDDPTLAAQESVPAPAADDSSLPEWARPQAPATAKHRPATPTRTASTSGDHAPVRNPESSSNPFAKHQPEQVKKATDATVATAAQNELRDLISQARRHEQRGALRKAHEAALEAAAIADREHMEFSRGEDRPAEVVRRLEERLQASTRDPFGDAPHDPAAPSAPQGTSPFASGSSLAGSLPWTTHVEPQSAPAAADSKPAFAGAPKTPTTPFPTAPEWRGVRANSPVSLAVVEQSATSAANIDSSHVRHADVDDDASANRMPGRLLPRNLSSHDPIFKSDDRTLALNAPSAADGPLLAPPPLDAAPVAIAPAPPLAAESGLAAQSMPTDADEELDRTGGYSGWIIGGVLLAAGLWLFGFGNRSASRRPAAAARQ